MKDEVAPPCVCLWPNDPEEPSLAHTVSLLTLMLFILVFFWTPHPLISCAAHLPQVFTNLTLLLSNSFNTSVSSVDLPKKTCLTPIISGNWAKLAVCIWKETLFRSSGSQAGCVGFSLPHLTSQRFKWLEPLSFSNKKTFWPAFCKFCELILNEN